MDIGISIVALTNSMTSIGSELPATTAPITVVIQGCLMNEEEKMQEKKALRRSQIYPCVLQKIMPKEN